MCVGSFLSLLAAVLSFTSRMGKFDWLPNKDLDSRFLIQSIIRSYKSRCLLTCLQDKDCLSAVIGPKLDCRLFAKDPRSLLYNNDLVLRNRNHFNLYLVSNRGFECLYNEHFQSALSLCKLTGKKVDSNCTEWSEKKPRWTTVCGGNLISGEFRERTCTRPFSGGLDCSGGYKTNVWSKKPYFLTHERKKQHFEAAEICEEINSELFTGLSYVVDGHWNAGIRLFYFKRQIRAVWCNAIFGKIKKIFLKTSILPRLRCAYKIVLITAF